MKSKDGWSHTILEVYCGRTWSTKKDKYLYKMLPNKKWKRVPNDDYDPKYKVPAKPDYCVDRPCFVCLDMACPHLAYCEADEEDYKLFLKRWDEKNETSHCRKQKLD